MAHKLIAVLQHFGRDRHGWDEDCVLGVLGALFAFQVDVAVGLVVVDAQDVRAAGIVTFPVNGGGLQHFCHI
jgi:hypothetical protein